MSIEGDLDGFNSHQLAADMPLKAHGKAGSQPDTQEGPRRKPEQILQCWLEGSRACLVTCPLLPAGSTLKFCFNTSLLHQQKFPFFLLPECREVVVGMFVGSLLSVYSQLMETKTKINK